MKTPINQQSVLTQKYIRQGLAPADAYAKAVAVLELIAEIRERCPDLTDAQVLRDAEQDYAAGEEAIRDHLGRVDRPVTITPTAGGLYLERGPQWLLLSARETAALVDQIKQQLAAGRRAEKRGRIHRRRLAEGRQTWTPRVVGGRLMNEQAA
jgi:hypothetical protein